MSESLPEAENLGGGAGAAPAADAPAPAPSLRDTLAAAYDAAEREPAPAEPGAEAAPPAPVDGEQPAPDRPRGPDGKFAPKPVEAAKPIESQAPQPAQAPLAPPQHWDAKAGADWNRLPRSVQSAIASMQPAPDPIRAVAQEFAQDIAAVGAPPEQLFRSLLVAERELRTNPVAALQWLARSYNVNLASLAPKQPAGQPQGAADPGDPTQTLMAELQQLREQVQETRHMTMAQRQAELRRHQDEAAAEIAAFAKDRPHFDAARSDMALLIAQGRTKDLAEAYDMAIWANPQTRAALLQEQQAEQTKREEAATRATAARRAGAINVRGTVGTSPTPPRTVRETMEATFDAINGGG